MELMVLGLFSVLGLFVLIAIGSSFFVVQSQTAVVIERLGKFNSIATEGLNFKVPFIDSIVAKLDLKINQLDVEVETKTHDNVFVTTQISVQYQVLKDKVKDAHYKLSDAKAQIESYVFDVVRSEIPKLKLDDVFINKDSIAQAVKSILGDEMDDFGFQIIKTLITDIDPDEKVKQSMNEINSAQRHREAANEKAEAEKILLIKNAEAESESKRLQGEGLAKQRKEIAKGLKESIDDLLETGLDNEQVTTLLLINQHYDAITAVVKAGGTNTILLPYSANQVTSMREQITEALLSTKK